MAGIWETGFGVVPTISRTGKSGSLCLKTVCANNKVYAEYLLYFWKPENLVCAKQRVLIWASPIKTLANESLMAFPGRQYFTQLNEALTETIWALKKKKN